MAFFDRRDESEMRQKGLYENLLSYCRVKKCAGIPECFPSDLQTHQVFDELAIGRCSDGYIRDALRLAEANQELLNLWEAMQSSEHYVSSDTKAMIKSFIAGISADVKRKKIEARTKERYGYYDAQLEKQLLEASEE